MLACMDLLVPSWQVLAELPVERGDDLSGDARTRLRNLNPNLEATPYKPLLRMMLASAAVSRTKREF